jgi:hypothetical protein
VPRWRLFARQLLCTAAAIVSDLSWQKGAWLATFYSHNCCAFWRQQLCLVCCSGRCRVRDLPSRNCYAFWRQQLTLSSSPPLNYCAFLGGNNLPFAAEFPVFCCASLAATTAMIWCRTAGDCCASYAATIVLIVGRERVQFSRVCCPKVTAGEAVKLGRWHHIFIALGSAGKVGENGENGKK